MSFNDGNIKRNLNVPEDPKIIYQSFTVDISGNKVEVLKLGEKYLDLLDEFVNLVKSRISS